MKTKKILAIVTLVAFMVSILPMAAFAEISAFGSTVTVETSSAKAVALPGTHNGDGLEYELTLVGTAGADVSGDIYVATNRGTNDVVFYKIDGQTTWTKGNVISIASATDIKVKEVVVQIQSNIAGNIKVAFGTSQTAVNDYAAGRSFTGTDSMADILGQKLFDGTFTAASANSIVLKRETSDPKPANGVTYHEVTATVMAAGYPVSGKEVSFSISGTGAVLSASKVTTKANGQASVKITATKPDTYTVTAKVDDIDEEITVKFESTGIVDIKALSDDNQKIARDSGSKSFKYALYDVAGNRIRIDAVSEVVGLEVDVTKKPSGSDFDVEIADFTVDKGDLKLAFDTKDLDKDGEYAIRVNLLNGKSVTYSFSAKEQGDIVAMELDYDAQSYAAEATVAAPTIKYSDAEGYTTEEAPSTDVKFSASNYKFIDGVIDADGGFTLSDELGTFIITAVDTDNDLVATATFTVGKAASALKLTAPTFTAVGEEAEVSIQLVDADGKAVTNNREATSIKAIVLSKPAGAIVSVDEDADDFEDGVASVDVSSNVAGTVVIQVVIVEDGGKVYTGSASVAFGEAAAAMKSLIMFIGSNNYIVGNQPAVTDAAPFIKDGRTYVAVRPIGDALGSTIYWDAATQTVTLVKPGETVTIVIGSSVIKVDRAGVVTEYPTDAPAHIKDGRTYLPFRAIGEAMGYTVTWDAATQAVIFS